MRPLPSAEIPTLAERKTPGRTITVELATITWVFGGSANPREVDPQRPIRVSTIRGHLRFWWRALYARDYASDAEMFVAEEAIFGSATQPGAVRITVDLLDKGTQVDDFIPTEPRRNGQGMVPRARGWKLYAGFPFQQDGNQAAAKGVKDVRFRLTLTVRDAGLEPQLRNTVAYWVHLGGYGARTRRGFGSLARTGGDVLSLTPPRRGPRAGLTQKGSYLYAVDGRAPYRDPIDAWGRAVSLYQEFRQGPGVGRAAGVGGHPGASLWPEADAIRSLAGAQESPQLYPRGDLGMPITFHFIGGGEPPDHTLQPTQTHRMASPIITKAMAVNGGYVAVIALLSAPHTWEAGVELQAKGSPHGVPISPPMLKPPQEELDAIVPLQGLSAREAFVKLARERGFTLGNL